LPHHPPSPPQVNPSLQDKGCFLGTYFGELLNKVLSIDTYDCPLASSTKNAMTVTIFSRANGRNFSSGKIGTTSSSSSSTSSSSVTSIWKTENGQFYISLSLSSPNWQSWAIRRLGVKLQVACDQAFVRISWSEIWRTGSLDFSLKKKFTSVVIVLTDNKYRLCRRKRKSVHICKYLTDIQSIKCFYSWGRLFKSRLA
jgi:hypothetical protein